MIDILTETLEEMAKSRTGAIPLNLANEFLVAYRLLHQPPIEDILTQAQERPFPFDRIVIPGAGIRPDCNPIELNHDSMMRVIAAWVLARNQVAPEIFSQGGPEPKSGTGPISLVIKRVLETFCPDVLLTTDEDSHNSVTNAIELADKEGLLIAVTSFQHVFRYALNCANHGVDLRRLYVYSADEIVRKFEVGCYEQFRERDQRRRDEKIIHELKGIFCLSIDPRSYVERVRDGDITWHLNKT